MLREYETAHIGKEWNLETKTVSRKEAALIDFHQRSTGRKLFDLSYKSIKATNWVGVLGLQTRCIEVVPKIDEPSDLKTRENLLYMLSRAGLVPLSIADIAWLANRNKPLIVAYMELFVDNLAKEWRKGQIKKYVPKDENRTCLKGKILFPLHLKTNLLHQERFYTTCDEFTSDNPISQLFKFALRKCHEQKLSLRLAQKAKNLISDFDDVSDVEISNDLLTKVKVDRCIIRFEPLLNMAKFIIRDISPSPSDKGDVVYSLMFDMNEVFERFIANEFKAALRGEFCRVNYQVKGKSLLKKLGRQRFALKPDIGIFSKGKYICLVDTKWKQLDINKPHDNVSQADIYQMYAYGKEYDSPKVILLYPQHSDLPCAVAEYEHMGVDPNKRIMVWTVNVSKPLNRQDVKLQLHKTLCEMVLEDSFGKIQ